MIVYHTPSSCWFRGRTRQHTHLSSTLFGSEGTQELLAFGDKIGMRRAWIQDQGTPKEHFDVFDSKIDAAARAGAVLVRPPEFIQLVVKPKREAARGELPHAVELSQGVKRGA